MGLDSLDEESLFLILGFLAPRDIPSVALLNTYFRDFVRERERFLWKALLKHSFGVEFESLHPGVPNQWSGAFPDLENSRVPERDLALRFHKICMKYGSVGYRMIRVWNGIYLWAQRHALPLKETLLPGVSLERLDKCDQLVRRRSHDIHALPLELGSMYALCGGQSFARLRMPSGDPFELNDIDELSEGFPEGQLEFNDAPGCIQLQGLFGGMKVYHDEFSLSLIPFETMVYCSIFKRLSRTRFLIALNLYGVRYKHMYLEPKSGQLQFDPKPGMPNGIDCISSSRRVYEPGKPPPPWYIAPGDAMKRIPQHYPETEDHVHDMGYAVFPIVAMMHWFESYMIELSRGNFRYKFVPELGEHIIWKFPALPPECSELITSGISVKSSCVLAPHAIQNPSLGLVWAYTIQFRLLSIDEQNEIDPAPLGGPLKSVQLRERYWRISSANGTEEVQGEGVIGHFPILEEGGETFEYSSYTSITTQTRYTHKDLSIQGTMDGYFTFEEHLEGTSTPCRTVNASCPRMHLCFPNIVY